MSGDRTVRRLTALERSASTSRVLNLLSTHRRPGAEAGLAGVPMFENRLLDRSIILKHRLRPHEYADFDLPRPTVTKLLIPLDPADLRLGARFAFYGQRDFEAVVGAATGCDLSRGTRDRQVLDLIDSLPSLDPFLLREQLKRNGFEPARAYFNISEADVQRMHAFARAELMALASLSHDRGGDRVHAARLVEKLLASDPNTAFEPLKDTLKLSDREHQDGLFSWRGFLYYKWALGDLIQPMHAVSGQIARLLPRGPRDPEASAYLLEARNRVRTAIGEVYSGAEDMLRMYDSAYAALTRDSQPAAFRDFLLSAPAMFVALGERVGALQHVISFWRYRFPPGKPALASPSELMDLLLDFEDSMAFGPQDAPYARCA